MANSPITSHLSGSLIVGPSPNASITADNALAIGTIECTALVVSGASTLTGNSAVTGTLSVAGESSLNKVTIDSGTKTATATSGAATLNKLMGTITTEALTTAAGAVYTLTITDSVIAATDVVMSEIQNGTNTTVGASILTVAPAAGSIVVKVQNLHASAALNGTLLISFVAFKLA